ncbi:MULTISPECIES: nitrogenase iron-molybdenum cofactor biosynthesis protein NifN [Methanobacterium]|uniref:Nitrogenase iron-molybdenum cofactor biosynthesis protein NifN n=1 Tax=Methanobacterium veterum TaxID=408577 RepID=A0A9E5A383_9EURY|nr:MULTISPECIES: nitrogenase iron-molybdenum cofactor biosynthesis protein NifN [Methanobacterium]MCZ3366240.1 nitrogenase iron-molybdenum cofactor biosynthesis protein NifN [Methanobacterium veterum]MCZ3371532.1 nitrogenase iron-molybdenum cofactor biosynthesis protein NifN [Methanobacterium veterum]
MHHDKKFAVVNPSKMCQPMGAIQALLGVKDSMPLIHGSQGCSTYIRFQLTRHFREPIEVASTSMSEKTVIYGGEFNLMKALKNITEKQSPSMIAVTSSCLTETIGDDMVGIIEKFEDANLDKELPVIIPISTPSYVESHVEGYNRTIKALVEHLATPTVENGKINIITGNISPADVKEVKNILKEMDCESIILTDTSENLDAPLTEDALSLYNGGTTIEEIEDTANSLGTISLSKHVDSAGVFLEKKFGVKSISGPIPIGLENTDSFVKSVSELGDLEIPESIEKDRGRLIDTMVDAHSYNYHRKVAIFGDPDFVSGLTRFTCEMGMIPTVVCTGTESKRFIEDINNISEEKGVSPTILAGGDLYDMHREIKEAGADILIGNAYGASIAQEENIPLFRVGFPVFDRLGAQRISVLGYTGGIDFVDKLTNTILDFYYDEAGYEIEEPEEVVEEFAREEI